MFKDKLALTHFSNLDFVRSFAVLLVAGRHFAGNLGITHVGSIPLQLIGIFGVLIFFVLTAMVLMFSLDRIIESKKNKSEAYISFLIKRLFRIYPLSIAVVLVGFFVYRNFEFSGFNNLSGADLRDNLLLIQNLTGAPDALGVLWSLPIEVQMYLLLPAIYFMIVGRSIYRLFSIYAISLVAALLSYKVPYAHVIRYAPCFMSGVIAYWIVRRHSFVKLPFFILPITLVILVATYGKLGQWSQTVAGYPVCLAIGVLLPNIKQSACESLKKLCAHIAKYSFGIYLIHAPIIKMCLMIEAPLVLKFIMAVFGTWCLSVLAYKIIEHPMIVLGNKIS